MLEKLSEIANKLPHLLLEKANAGEIKTMYIDYHKPFVSRIWFKHEDLRVFLHKIEPCNDSAEALYHPHKWDSAMLILNGVYEMGIGHSKTNKTPKTDCKIQLSRGARYEMTEKDAWHYVNPLGGPCFTLMITGKLNGREMPIEPDKEFRTLEKNEIVEILSTAPNMRGVYLSQLCNKIFKNQKHGNNR